MLISKVLLSKVKPVAFTTFCSAVTSILVLLVLVALPLLAPRPPEMVVLPELEELTFISTLKGTQLLMVVMGPEMFPTAVTTSPWPWEKGTATRHAAMSSNKTLVFMIAVF
jgi:hypothetical protein